VRCRVNIIFYLYKLNLKFQHVCSYYTLGNSKKPLALYTVCPLMKMNRHFLPSGGGKIIRSQAIGATAAKNCSPNSATVFTLRCATWDKIRDADEKRDFCFNCMSLIWNTALKIFRGHFVQNVPWSQLQAQASIKILIHDMRCTFKTNLRRVRTTTVSVEKEQVLYILSVCL